LTVVCVVAVLVRLVLLSVQPVELGPTAAAAPEELHRGMTALEMTRGPLLDFFAYQWNATWGGTLVMSVLAIPGFQLLGPSLFALRLPTVLFALLGVVVVFSFLDRFVSRRAAWIGGMLVALAPPGYTLLASKAWGTHVELGVLSLTLVYLVLCHRRSPRPSGASAFVIGLLAGFGLYFGLGMLFTLAFLAGFELVVDRRNAPKRCWPWRIVGFVVGLVPFALYRLWAGSAGLRVNNRGIAGEPMLAGDILSDPLERLAALVGRDFAGSLAFPDLGPLPGGLIGGGFALVLGFGLLWALWGAPRVLRGVGGVHARVGLFLATYATLFLGAYLLSSFTLKPELGPFGHRYLAPVLPWLLMVAAVALDAFSRRGRSIGLLAMGTAVTLSLLSTASLFSLCRVGSGTGSFSFPGYSLEFYGNFIVKRFSDRPEVLRRVVDGLMEEREEEEAREVLFSMGQVLKQLTRPDLEVPDLHTFLPREDYQQARAMLHAHVEPRYKPYFSKPVAGEPRYGNERRERFENLFKRNQRLDRRARRQAAEKSKGDG